MSKKKSIYHNYFNLLYHLSILIISFFIFISNSPGIAFGSNVYVDPSCQYNGDGTFNNGTCAPGAGKPGPYNTWSGVTIKASEDYRQKCGTTYTGTLTITTSGTANDHIIIGAYFDNANNPVHEDDNPSFGRFCDNNVQKPIIRNNLIYPYTGVLIKTGQGGSQYLDINSLQLQGARYGVQIDSQYNAVKYCYLYKVVWGMRIGIIGASVDADYTTIEYNYIDSYDTTDEDEGVASGDGINFGYKANYGTVQYNRITGFDHLGINLEGSDNHLVQYNYVYTSDNNSEDYCIGSAPRYDGSYYTSDNSIIRFNYCDSVGTGYGASGANNNEIYGNIFICNNSTVPFDYQGCVQYTSNFKSSNFPTQYNKFYNNMIYDNDNKIDNSGIRLQALSGNLSIISENKFYNNIILKMNGDCIKVSDLNNKIDINYFYNNSCYDYGVSYADMEDGLKKAGQLNSEANASGNIDDDPGLKNPLTGQFWPDSISASVVGKGYNIGVKFNQILDPEGTDFTASPPIVKTIDQPADWYIGPYALRSQKKPENPDPHTVLGLHVKPKEEENTN